MCLHFVSNFLCYENIVRDQIAVCFEIRVWLIYVIVQLFKTMPLLSNLFMVEIQNIIELVVLLLVVESFQEQYGYVKNISHG